MKNYLECQSLLKQLWPWKLHLVIVGFVAIVLTVLFSSPMFITPLYRSQTRLYPVNTKAFSEESESEQMLEVICSSDLKRTMIERFGLMERYDIDPGSRSAQSKVLKQYDEFVNCSKTRYETVEISIQDRDPAFACAMVDSLVKFYNVKMVEMHREKYNGQLAAFQEDLIRKQKEIDALSEQMETYRQQYGLLDYNSQTQQLTLGYAEALARSASRASVEDLKRRLDLLAEKGGVFQQMQAKMEELLSQRESIAAQLEETNNLVHRDENFSLMVEAPFPADKKSYPTRWIIVLASLFAVEFLAILVILLTESFGKTKA